MRDLLLCRCERLVLFGAVVFGRAREREGGREGGRGERRPGLEGCASAAARHPSERAAEAPHQTRLDQIYTQRFFKFERIRDSLVQSEVGSDSLSSPDAIARQPAGNVMELVCMLRLQQMLLLLLLLLLLHFQLKILGQFRVADRCL